MGGGDGHACQDIGLVENTNCRFIEGQGLDIGRPLLPSFAVGTRDPSHVDRFTPGLGGDGTNNPSNLDGIADIQWRANVNPTESRAEQYNVRVDFNATARDLIAFSMFRVPQSSDSFNGSTREMNLFHHTQSNEAETVIWNHVFAGSMLNEARANVAGWNWKDLENNPDGPWGLPSVYIQRVDSSGTIGTIQPNNHLDFGIGAPGLFDQKTIGVKNTLTKVFKSHTLKLGGEITRMSFVDTAPWSARPSYYFNNMWDFLNDAPSAENATFDPRTGVPTDFRKDTRQTLVCALRAGRLQAEVEPDADVGPAVGTLRLDLREERQPELRRARIRRKCADRDVAQAGRHAVRGEPGRFRSAGWRHLEPLEVRQQDGAAWRFWHRLQRAGSGHFTQRPEQPAVSVGGRQPDGKPDRLRRRQFPIRRSRVLRLRVESGYHRQLRPEHQPAGARSELRADCRDRFPRQVADDHLVSLFCRCRATTSAASGWPRLAIRGARPAT